VGGGGCGGVRGRGGGEGGGGGAGCVGGGGVGVVCAPAWSRKLGNSREWVDSRGINMEWE